MMMIKFAALALISCVFSLALRKDQPAFAFLVSVCGAVCLLGVVARQLQPVVTWLQTLAVYTQGQHLSCLLQVLGIALVAQFAADLCRDAGLASAAAAAELGGRMLALLQVLPLIESLIGSFLSFLR